MPAPQGKYGQTYDALMAPVSKRGWKVPFNLASVAIGPFGASTKAIVLNATQPCFVEFGDSSVVAVAPASSPPAVGSHYVPSGEIVTFHRGGPDKGTQFDYLAVVLESSTGILYVSEQE